MLWLSVYKKGDWPIYITRMRFHRNSLELTGKFDFRWASMFSNCLSFLHKCKCWICFFFISLTDSTRKLFIQRSSLLMSNATSQKVSKLHHKSGILLSFKFVCFWFLVVCVLFSFWLAIDNTVLKKNKTLSLPYLIVVTRVSRPYFFFLSIVDYWLPRKCHNEKYWCASRSTTFLLIRIDSNIVGNHFVKARTFFFFWLRIWFQLQSFSQLTSRGVFKVTQVLIVLNQFYLSSSVLLL